MAKRRPYIGPSEAQANAEALARRSAPYTVASSVSFSVAWDWRKRAPRDLREAVRAARQAYADEIPTKLHEGYDSIGPDGTPKMTARAQGYIFGSPYGNDAQVDVETGLPDAVGYYHAPFRARLAQMGSDPRAVIVSHITIGNAGPVEAAIAVGVPAWCAKLVAEDALRVFLMGLSDIRLNGPVQEGITAA